MTIYFYSVRGEYGEFSNFSRHGVTFEGKYYPTTEHYFQAQKFVTTDPAHAERIRTAHSPKQAAEFGRDRNHRLRPDWESVKDDIMLTGLRAKFTTHPALRVLLLSTGENELVEKTTGDLYWGCGTNGDGKNMLGKLLMQLRTELQK